MYTRYQIWRSRGIARLVSRYCKDTIEAMVGSRRTGEVVVGTFKGGKEVHPEEDT